jgi:hypothetical protein
MVYLARPVAVLLRLRLTRTQRGEKIRPVALEPNRGAMVARDFQGDMLRLTPQDCVLPTIGLAATASQVIAVLGCMTGMVIVHAS